MDALFWLFPQRIRKILGRLTLESNPHPENSKLKTPACATLRQLHQRQHHKSSKIVGTVENDSTAIADVGFTRRRGLSCCRHDGPPVALINSKVLYAAFCQS
jgi:hypothetical protein